MPVPYLDLSRALRAERADLQAAFDSVRDGGRLVLGPAVGAFEEAYAASVGCRHGVGCASGTDAITLALMALGVDAGDEVVTVSMTCAPTAVGIVRAGARPVFVDVDPVTLTMDPGALEAALGERTRAVLPVHLYGRPADLASILRIAGARGVPVVEDCAQAHGAAFGGRPAGSLGVASAWSFYPTKNLGALGDGGMVTTSDATVEARLRRLRLYGYATRNDAEGPGLNSRLDELQAAFLTRRLARLAAGNARRAALAARYRAGLRSVVELPPEVPGDAHHLFVVRHPERDRLRAALAARGVGTDLHYPRAVHEQPAFAGFVRAPLPVTERAMAEVLSLPLYPELEDGEQETVIRELRALV